MKKDWHIISFEEDKNEDKYAFIEWEIWSENIIPLVKDILITQLGSKNDINESSFGKYFVDSLVKGKRYLQNLHQYSYEWLSIRFIDQKLMVKIKINYFINAFYEENIKVFKKLLKNLKESKWSS